MKKILLILSITFAGSAFSESRLKEVCRNKLDKSGNVIVDKKTGKISQECRTIKVRKKLAGKKVPVTK